MFKKIVDWVMKSSADPAKLSLTLKAGIPLLAFFGMSSVVGEQELSGAIDVLAATISSAGIALSGIFTLYGFGRKVWNSIFAK